MMVGSAGAPHLAFAERGWSEVAPAQASTGYVNDRQVAATDRRARHVMNEQAKSDLLNKLTYGLYVATAASGDERGAMLITWVTQASFDPPMVAVAVQTGAHTTAVMKQSGAFALNFMGDEQRRAAGRFG